MAVKVAINGFGRIGRLAFRQMFGDVYKRQVCGCVPEGDGLFSKASAVRFNPLLGF